jgi:hypothetical protein
VFLTFQCPKCREMNREAVSPGQPTHCAACAWTSPPEYVAATNQPQQCVICGCNDLWRQKDFPQAMGLLMVGLAIVGSTIAYALWHPILALGILMFFALVDAAIYLLMRDVLVCYRCRARHGGFEIKAHAAFDLETAERYRQERLRLEALTGPPS